MRDRGFIIQFSDSSQTQLADETTPQFAQLGLRDLTSLYWSSIDNDESRDLDQIECTIKEEKGIRVYVGVADVDWFVPQGSPLDQDAAHNTTSVYTGVETFPMLPERLSTDLSSLNENEKRVAMIVEMLVGPEATILESSIYPAIVENKAQLTYDAVAEWLDNQDKENKSVEPAEAGRRTLEKIESSSELRNQLRLQDQVAELLRESRHKAGALTFHTVELQPKMSNGEVVDLYARQHNRASLVIEDLMIAANETTAEFLDAHRTPSIRRVVRTPKRWAGIVSLASSLGTELPETPDGPSLEAFLKDQQKKNPAHFADLSFAVIKLLGRGEYVLKMPGTDAPGHFGLAVENYSHSTAPNRRYPDVLTQRLLKAAIAGHPSSYSANELTDLARHCTQKEDDANKVERLVRKCAAAVLLRPRIGESFDAIVSGVNSDGTWVRLVHPPIEGKLDGRLPHLDVGHKVRVRLVSTNPEKGFIDFELTR